VTTEMASAANAASLPLRLIDVSPFGCSAPAVTEPNLLSSIMC
jgi:hypothetical protein